MNYKYANSEHKVVYRINADSTCESHLVESKEIQEYIKNGGIIDLED